MCVHICTDHRCLLTTAQSRLLVASLLLEVAASSGPAGVISTPSRGRTWKLMGQKCHELGVGVIPSSPRAQLRGQQCLFLGSKWLGRGTS